MSSCDLFIEQETCQKQHCDPCFDKRPLPLPCALNNGNARMGRSQHLFIFYVKTLLNAAWFLDISFHHLRQQLASNACVHQAVAVFIFFITGINWRSIHRIAHNAKINNSCYPTQPFEKWIIKSVVYCPCFQAILFWLAVMCMKCWDHDKTFANTIGLSKLLDIITLLSTP